MDLPNSSRIHPVFHVSLLKPCYGQPTSQISPIPDPNMFPPPFPILVAISDRRLSKLGKEEFLIEWEGLPSSEASWIDKDEFQQ
ncbi:hypothetical protein A2U01_0062745 [Trifolium medium]|uniref:Chromo domain-containing protein n=1 Tax=Trifolium medium TaxID=97028 RepID=A0A392RZF1_9FABA|nr:hypothetical protein [Trifolium medium]